MLLCCYVLLRAQPAAAILHPAQAMTPPQRRRLALAALTGEETVSGLAREHQVSRKFVYHQAGKADEALGGDRVHRVRVVVRNPR